MDDPSKTRVDPPTTLVGAGYTGVQHATYIQTDQIVFEVHSEEARNTPLTLGIHTETFQQKPQIRYELP